MFQLFKLMRISSSRWSASHFPSQLMFSLNPFVLLSQPSFFRQRIVERCFGRQFSSTTILPAHIGDYVTTRNEENFEHSSLHLFCVGVRPTYVHARLFRVQVNPSWILFFLCFITNALVVDALAGRRWGIKLWLRCVESTSHENSLWLPVSTILYGYRIPIDIIMIISATVRRD